MATADTILWNVAAGGERLYGFMEFVKESHEWGMQSVAVKHSTFRRYPQR